MRGSYNKHRGGFTLVELLVVIGIIAMLIAILLPVLSKARYQAQLIACASNVRQFGMTLQLYANQSSGYLPLSYYSSKQSQDCELGTGLSNGGKAVPTLLAQSLIDTGLMNDATVKALYCPLERNPRMMFNGTNNPWPLKAFGFTFASYGVRPLVNTYPNATNNGLILALPITGGNGGYWLESKHVAGLPKQTKLKPWTAIIADSTMPSTSNEKPFSHIDKGLNVAFADGSVTWVPVGAYQTHYKLGLFDPSSDVMYYDSSTGFWPDFDNYHKH